MKKITGLLAAGVLALSLAAPASAAPIQNPHVSMWEIVCAEPIGTFTVIAKGVPGWPTDFERGTAPVHLRAATWYAWENGQIVDGPYTLLPPPGLEAKLVGPCLLHVYGGDPAVFDLRSEQTWFQFP